MVQMIAAGLKLAHPGVFDVHYLHIAKQRNKILSSESARPRA
jgi:hypothetical protein